MNFSVRQLQEKYGDQNIPLYMLFIGITKTFGLVSLIKQKILLSPVITICDVLYNTMGMCMNLLKFEILSRKLAY